MKKYTKILTFAAVCCMGFATACSNNASSEEEQQAIKMDSVKDSLEVTSEQVDEDIKDVQAAMKEVDDKFEKQ